jgi:glycosyltransferase involved in cell wall biosynthesis
MLAVIETHPIQYRGPLYRMLQRDFGVPVTAIYGSDFSVAGYRDPGFGQELRWDVDLLSGYDSVFLTRVAAGGAKVMEDVKTDGLRAALRKINPTAVLVTGYSPRYHQAGFWHAWRGGWPILFRGEATDLSPRGMARDAFLGLLYSRCRRVLYIGQSAKRHYLAHGVAEDKLVFSPYVVNTEPFDRDAPAPARSERRVILFSGKLTEVKRPDLLIRAVQGMPVSLIFLGDGPLRPELERLAGELRVETQFTGFQNQTQLSPYYRAADMLCLPSDWDTWGLVVNEALYHGVPCVVSDRVGCASDLITPGVTGDIFPAGSVAELRAAIERVLPLTRRPATAQACRERESHYTMERAAAGIAEAYRAL